MQVVTLHNAHLRAQVLPAFGGGLARLDTAGTAPHALLRGLAPDNDAPTPSQLACFPLVPWSNRIGTAGFDFDGKRYDLIPNRAGEPCPIHGEGFQLPWEIDARSDTSVELSLERRERAPFSYVAHMRYGLDGPALEISLEVVNCGDTTMPFGLGLHPWLPRTDGVQLRAAADATWDRGADGLPTTRIAIPSDWDFSSLQCLPGRSIDNVFSGWDGEAEVFWPETGHRLAIRADMGYYIVYTRPEADFFCFEPVDHMINAHNLQGGPARHGLTLLAPGQTLVRSVRFSLG